MILKQILQLDQGLNIKIAKVAIAPPTAYDIEALDAVGIFDETRSWQPRIQAGSMQIESAQFEVALMRTSLIPTISLFASVGSRFSSLAKRQGRQAGINTVEQDITLNGESVIFSFEEPFYNFNNIPYRDQLRENLDYGLGLNIAIPIYNQGQNRSNLHLAELEVARITNAVKSAENDLKSEILSAVTQVEAGMVQYEVAQRTVEAMNMAFLDAEKQYTLGLINSLDFVTAQNNRDQALVNLNATKYEYLFRTMVLDFYRGKKLDFDW